MDTKPQLALAGRQWPAPTSTLRALRISGLRAAAIRYLGSSGCSRPGKGSAGASRVHGAVLWHIQGPIEVIHVHQWVQSLGLCRTQHMGLHTIGLAQLEGPEEAERWELFWELPGHQPDPQRPPHPDP